MKISFYNRDYEKITIRNIEYVCFNGKDTIVDYSNDGNGETYCANFEGWISIEQIIKQLENI